MRRAHAARRSPGQQPRNRHMAMHEIKLLPRQKPPQLGKGAGLRQRVQAAGKARGMDAKPLRPRQIEQWPLGANPHHLMAPRPRAAHQRQQEMPQREIDIGDLTDAHRPPR